MDKLRERIETTKFGLQKSMTRQLSLAEGYITLERGDYGEAISHFRKAQELLAFPYPGVGGNMGLYAWYFEPLALASYRSGDLEKAQEEYEKISKMTLGRVASWDIHAKSFYMLGKISEQRGWPGKAIEHYEKFLEVWKDADPDLTEVDDARQRLARLKSMRD